LRRTALTDPSRPYTPRCFRDNGSLVKTFNGAYGIRGYADGSVATGMSATEELTVTLLTVKWDRR